MPSSDEVRLLMLTRNQIQPFTVYKSQKKKALSELYVKTFLLLIIEKSYPNSFCHLALSTHAHHLSY